MRWIKGTVNGIYTEMREDGPWVLTDGEAMICPSCEAEMYEDELREELWHCPECGYSENRK